MKIEGYLAVYNNIDSHGDKFIPGCFDKYLSDLPNNPQPPILLWEHNTSQPIGKILELTSDDFGLHFVGELTDTEFVESTIKPLLESGTVDHFSICVNNAKCIEYSEDFGDDRTGYDIVECEIVEGSLVSVAANNKAILVEILKKSDSPRVLLAKKVSKKLLKMM